MPVIINSFRSGGVEGYTPNASYFDGTDYAGLASPSWTDGRKGIVSLWVRPDAFGSQMNIVTERQNLSFSVRIASGGTLVVSGKGSAGTSVLQIQTAASLTAGAWNHIAVSFDLTTLGAETSYAYLNGVSSQTVTTLTGGGNINYGTAPFGYYLCRGSASGYYAGGLAELYVNFTETIDLSNATNLQKFRTAGGLPVSLGADGSTPTGTAPAVYMKNPAATFGTNSGTGGNFTVTGTLTDTAPPP